MNTTDEVKDAVARLARAGTIISGHDINIVLAALERATARAEAAERDRDRYFATLAGALFAGHFDKLTVAELREPGEKLIAERNQLRGEVETLLWNLAGCDTIASGHSRPGEFNADMARPALHSVSKLRQERDELRAQLAALEASERRAHYEREDARQSLEYCREQLAAAKQEVERLKEAEADMAESLRLAQNCKDDMAAAEAKLAEAVRERDQLRAEVERLRSKEWEHYRMLKAGEMTQVGDEYLCGDDEGPWKIHDDASLNRPAPDPTCPAHTLYRRKIADDLRAQLAAAREDKERLAQVQAEFTAWQTSVIATIGGTVDGKATTTGNYLQRLRDLVAVEAEKREWILGLAKLVCKNRLLEQELAAAQDDKERLDWVITQGPESAGIGLNDKAWDAAIELNGNTDHEAIRAAIDAARQNA